MGLKKFFKNVVRIGAPIVGGILGGPPGLSAGLAVSGMVGASSSGGGASGAYQAQQDALTQAAQIQADAAVEAAGLIAAGQEAAAAATIEAAKLAADASLRMFGLGKEELARYHMIADQKLQPFVDNGLLASDQINKMLGLPDKDGNITPYTGDDLRQLPGYKFFFDEGQKAVDKSAVGTKLSGAQAKAQTQYGQGYAERFYDKQLGYLQHQQGIGANAANSQAQAAMNAGTAIMGGAVQSGGQQAQVYSNQGQQLAQIYTGGAAAQASLAGDLAANQANLAIAAANNRASMYASEQQRKSDFLGDILGVAGTIAGGYFGSRNRTV